MNGKEQQVHTTRLAKLGDDLEAAGLVLEALDGKVARMAADIVASFEAARTARQQELAAALAAERNIYAHRLENETIAWEGECRLLRLRVLQLEALADAGFWRRLRWLLFGTLPDAGWVARLQQGGPQQPPVGAPCQTGPN
jgi:hypothetical protein